MYNELKTFLVSRNTPDIFIEPILIAVAVIIVLLIVGIFSKLAKRFLVPVLEKAVRKSSNKWDDVLADNHFFVRISRLLPVAFLYLSVEVLFPEQRALAEFVKRLSMALFVIIAASSLDSLLTAARHISNTSSFSKEKAIGSYIDAARIIALVLAGIFLISVLTNKSPWGIISVFGGLTAVTLLIFKDTILGFIAGIQLSAHDMVRIGDWIEMPQYNADGDVIDVTIHTVKVRNWDKTISTIPTYALVTNSFKNWRGMSESGGRRIKRSLFIDMNTIKFCTEEMLDRFSKFSLITGYLEEKKKDIDAYNTAHNVDAAQLINGRRQTNIGVFRAYIVNYLRSHPKIHQNMTFLVRHLQPTSQGLPIEVYVFSNDQVWANYEAIQADIFDHILAAMPEFDLCVFQYPSGNDLRTLSISPNIS